MRVKEGGKTRCQKDDMKLETKSFMEESSYYEEDGDVKRVLRKRSGDKERGTD